MYFPRNLLFEKKLIQIGSSVWEPNSKNKSKMEMEQESKEETITSELPVVCPFTLSPELKECYDHIEQLIKNQDFSMEAFEFTTKAIRINASNYNVWIHRQKCMKALNIPLENDFDLCEAVIRCNIKNYQSWMHRLYIVSNTKSYQNELQFTENILKLDEKNMHAWGHRYYVVSTFNQWDGELEFTKKLLVNDCRNNSAFVHRFNVIKHFYLMDHNTEVLEKEISYMKELLRVPHNQSLWNYIRGFIREYKEECILQFEDYLLEFSKIWVTNTEVFITCAEIYRKRKEFENCAKMYYTLIDICPYRINLWNNLLSTLPQN